MIVEARACSAGVGLNENLNAIERRAAPASFKRLSEDD